MPKGKENLMSPVYKAVISGWTFAFAFKSLHQDLIGKEAYLKMVECGWVTPWITIPLACMLVVIAGILFYQAQKGQ